MALARSYLEDDRPGATKKTYSEAHPGISSLGLILLTIAVIGIVYGLCLLLVSTVIGGSKQHLIARQKEILYAVDPSSLLTACRQLAVNGSGQIDPASPTVPNVIHRIDPNRIIIADNRVVLECGSEAMHFGVVANVSENGATTQVSPPVASSSMVRELTSGLWYYSDDGIAPPP